MNSCDGSERRASTRSSVARCIDGWVRHTLQEFIDLYALAVPCNSCCIQVHVVNFRYTTRSMDDHVCLKRALLTRSGGLNNQLAGVSFNAYDFSPQLDVNPKLASMLHNLIDQVRVKERKGTRATMHDRDFCSCTHGHMSKFERNVSPSNKQKPLWKLLQLQALFA